MLRGISNGNDLLVVVRKNSIRAKRKRVVECLVRSQAWRRGASGDLDRGKVFCA
jgi:hypothetical protein